MKLSVAMCTYNGELYIEKQLDSILNQTLAVNEIIICDDGSKDTTISILKKYQNLHPKLITIIENSINLGSNKNFEKAINLCDGDYIFLSDQDDLWDVEKAKKIIDIFNENPKAEGVFSNAKLIDNNDSAIFNDFTLWDSICFYENKIKSQTDLYKLILYRGNYLTGGTFCIKKEALQFCSPFKTVKEFLHDEWLAFALSQRNTLYYSKENLISYRIHTSQQVGVGGIQKAINQRRKKSTEIEKIVNFDLLKSYSDYKMITRKCFSQYEKYKLVIETYGNDPSVNNIKEELLETYIKFDSIMKQKYPIRYFFRKIKDKQKGKRQLTK